MRMWLSSILIVVGILDVTDSKVKASKSSDTEADEDLKKYPFSPDLQPPFFTSTSTSTAISDLTTSIYTTTEATAGNFTDDGTNILQQVIANLEKVNEILGKLPDWDGANRSLPPVSSENKTWKAKDDKNIGKKKIDSFKMIRFK